MAPRCSALVRHHGVDAGHFLEWTHRQPGLEGRLRTSLHDRAAVRRLSGRKFILTNAPRNYTMRVLETLGLARLFDGVISIEDMHMFGDLRPKPDARMFRFIAAKLKVRASDCVLVEDMLENPARPPPASACEPRGCSAISRAVSEGTCAVARASGTAPRRGRDTSACTVVPIHATCMPKSKGCNSCLRCDEQQL